MAESVKKPDLKTRMVNYFKEVKSELKKVVWPTIPQTLNNTLIVLTAIGIVAVFLFILDFIFAGTLSAALSGNFVQGFVNWFKFS